MEQQREPESTVTSLDNTALIDSFYATEGSYEVCAELSVRLVSHAGFEGDPHTEPLLGRDGAQKYDETTGKPLVVADYINYATDHHFHAIEGIFSFLHMEPGQENYNAGREIILAMLGQKTTG